MHYLATRCVYGVDLNPTAVELGSLTLWLATIHQLPLQDPQQAKASASDDGGNADGKILTRPGAVPWFGLRLRAGNSLIGARRAVFTSKQLQKKHHFGTDAVAPRLLTPGEARKKGDIYHWLVFDEDMAPAAQDKLVRSYHKDACEHVARWHKGQVKTAWTDEDCQTAERICLQADQHWQRYTQERHQALEQTQCTATVWPTPAWSTSAHAGSPNLADQEAVKQRLESSSGSFQRLKLVMDAWCSLFFQPIERFHMLPTRGMFLACAGFLLEDTCPNPAMAPIWSAKFGIDVTGLIEATQEQGGVPNADLLAVSVPWLGRASHIAEQQRFLHWELVYPEVLGPIAKHVGFDLLFGNPPWIKASWTDEPVLEDFSPKLGVSGAKSAAFNAARPKLLEDESQRQHYFNQLTSSVGSSTLLCNNRLYSELAGVQTNLYKNFIVRTWGLLSSQGMVGMLHPPGIYDDPSGSTLRAEIYSRLRLFCQFQNMTNLFHDVGGAMVFGLSVYGTSKNVYFDLITHTSLFAKK